MTKTLLIFESPAKCKKVEGYLGKEYICKASFGHIRDLDKKTLSIDIENGFKPSYKQLIDKKKVINELKKAAKGAKEVLIATDLDREGEAIGYHIVQVLGLDPKKTKRLVFNEITKKAMLHAVQHPRTLDINLFHAQQARRISDRLVGYLTTPLLWKEMDNYSLSAGRCQTPALNLIYDREKMIEMFQSNNYYTMTGSFSCADIDFDATHPKQIDKETCITYLEHSKK
jgi:DNA topoisomerase-1